MKGYGYDNRTTYVASYPGNTQIKVKLIIVIMKRVLSSVVIPILVN